ncbi:MAG: threonine synthase [Longimicrobiales bacterium]
MRDESVRGFDRSGIGQPGVIDRYRAFLPVGPGTPHLTLHEGSTPLLSAPRLADWVGVPELHLKFEGMNPSGSFKDRGMVVAVAKAIEEGATVVLCASTGNTAASAAAFAARAGLRAIVLLPGGKVAAGKVAQAVAYGARIVVVAGNFDQALDVARDASERYGVALVNSVNPYRIAGQTTAAYEICDALGQAPAVLALPVGNGGNITAYWLGFRRYREHGHSESLPRILGVQAAGAAPLVHGHPIEHPETIATAIRIGRPATWQPALDAANESGGAIRAVTDDEILAAYRAVSRLEGVFCEPASAAGIAGLRNAVRAGSLVPEGACVCVLTGNGLKDPDRALEGVGAFDEIGANAEELAKLIGL